MPFVFPVLILSLLVLAAVCGCSSSTPQRAVSDFISARIAGDDARAALLTVEEDLGDFLGGEPFLHASAVSFETEPPQAEGDRAVVTVSYSWDGQSVEVPYVARKVGNKWRVALSETQEMWLPGPGEADEDAG